MSNKEVKSLEGEQMDAIIAGAEVGSQHGKKELVADAVNDEKKDAVNEIDDDRPEDILIDGGTKENPEEVSDKGGAVNNVDFKDNNGKTNKEVQGVQNEDANNGEERKRPEVVAEGRTTIDEGLAASEHGLLDGNLTDQLENVANKLEAEEPMGTLPDDKARDCTTEDASIGNEVKGVTGRVNRPKRKLVKKKVVQNKTVLENSVGALDETKPQPSIANDAAGEAFNMDKKQHTKNEEKEEVKPLVKVKKKLIRMRKKVTEGPTAVAAANNEEKPKLTNGELGNEESNETDKQGIKNEEAEKSTERVSPSKTRGAKEVVREESKRDINMPGPSKKSKSSKKIDSMGMIFMCSSETKKDCYRYKVLGLPAGKKDVVSKIYKGMRLFLFDFELKLMYGIYKAASRGGYNIEPRAFKSQFPSQVRFTVLEDCLPLAEEKFKKVIKDNYYTKNKFDCQLTSDQVKNLCKLFHETSKRAESKQSGGSRIAAGPSSIKRDRKRKRNEDSRKVEHISSLPRGRSRRRAREEVRHGPLVDDRYYQPPPPVYERETYPRSVELETLYDPLPARSPMYSPTYSYGRASGVDIYGRDLALEHRDLRFSGSPELRPLELSHHDPYVLPREPRVYHLEPAYEIGVRREYSYDGRQAEYYTPPEYWPPLPPYRRY